MEGVGVHPIDTNRMGEDDCFQDKIVEDSSLPFDDLSSVANLPMVALPISDPMPHGIDLEMNMNWTLGTTDSLKLGDPFAANFMDDDSDSLDLGERMKHIIEELKANEDEMQKEELEELRQRGLVVSVDPICSEEVQAEKLVDVESKEKSESTEEKNADCAEKVNNLTRVSVIKRIGDNGSLPIVDHANHGEEFKDINVNENKECMENEKMPEEIADNNKHFEIVKTEIKSDEIVKESDSVVEAVKHIDMCDATDVSKEDSLESTKTVKTSSEAASIPAEPIIKSSKDSEKQDDIVKIQAEDIKMQENLDETVKESKLLNKQATQEPAEGINKADKNETKADISSDVNFKQKLTDQELEEGECDDDEEEEEKEEESEKTTKKEVEAEIEAPVIKEKKPVEKDKKLMKSSSKDVEIVKDSKGSLSPTPSSGKASKSSEESEKPKRKHKEGEESIEERRLKRRKNNHYSSEEEEEAPRTKHNSGINKMIDFDTLLKQEMNMVTGDGSKAMGKYNHQGRGDSNSESCGDDDDDPQSRKSRWSNSRKRPAPSSSRRRRSRSRGSPPISSKKNVCPFYLNGNCYKGFSCPFAHVSGSSGSLRKMELCKFYMMDCCAKKEKCLYMHHDFPCKFYHLGIKCEQGSLCKFSHNPLNDDTRAILLKHIEMAPKDILGNFVRLSKQCSSLMLDITEAKRNHKDVPEEWLDPVRELGGKGFKYLDRALKSSRRKADPSKKDKKGEKRENADMSKSSEPKKRRSHEENRSSQNDSEMMLNSQKDEEYNRDDNNYRGREGTIDFLDDCPDDVGARDFRDINQSRESNRDRDFRNANKDFRDQNMSRDGLRDFRDQNQNRDFRDQNQNRDGNRDFGDQNPIRDCNRDFRDRNQNREGLRDFRDQSLNRDGTADFRERGQTKEGTQDFGDPEREGSRDFRDRNNRNFSDERNNDRSDRRDYKEKQRSSRRDRRFDNEPRRDDRRNRARNSDFNQDGPTGPGGNGDKDYNDPMNKDYIESLPQSQRELFNRIEQRRTSSNKDRKEGYDSQRSDYDERPMDNAWYSSDEGISGGDHNTSSQGRSTCPNRDNYSAKDAGGVERYRRGGDLIPEEFVSKKDAPSSSSSTLEGIDVSYLKSLLSSITGSRSKVNDSKSPEKHGSENANADSRYSDPTYGRRPSRDDDRKYNERNMGQRRDYNLDRRGSYKNAPAYEGDFKDVFGDAPTKIQPHSNVDISSFIQNVREKVIGDPRDNSPDMRNRQSDSRPSKDPKDEPTKPTINLRDLIQSKYENEGNNTGGNKRFWDTYRSQSDHENKEESQSTRDGDFTARGTGMWSPNAQRDQGTYKDPLSGWRRENQPEFNRSPSYPGQKPSGVSVRDPRMAAKGSPSQNSDKDRVLEKETSPNRPNLSTQTSISSDIQVLPTSKPEDKLPRVNAAGNTYVRSIYEIDLDEIKARRNSGELDDNAFPFKLAPDHEPAKEINASITSHPPMVYRLIEITVPRPDFSRLKIDKDDPKLLDDPRICRMLRKISMDEKSSKNSSSDASSYIGSPNIDPRAKVDLEMKEKSSRDPRSETIGSPRNDPRSVPRSDPRMARQDPRASSSRNDPRNGRDDQMPVMEQGMEGGMMYGNMMDGGPNYNPYGQMGPAPSVPHLFNPMGRPGLLGPAPLGGSGNQNMNAGMGPGPNQMNQVMGPYMGGYMPNDMDMMTGLPPGNMGGPPNIGGPHMGGPPPNMIIPPNMGMSQNMVGPPDFCGPPNMGVPPNMGPGGPSAGMGGLPQNMPHQGSKWGSGGMSYNDPRLKRNKD